MFRFLVFLLVVLGLALLFAWISDNPGMVFLQWDWLAAQMGRPGEEVGIPLTLALAILVGLIISVMIVWSIVRNIMGAPSGISKYFDNRKREKGYKALSQGLIAASSGDASTARRLTRESQKFLGADPLVSLLGTQTAILEGKREEACENFKAMLADDSTRMVALRGLFMEAERRGEVEAARHYAQEASKTDSSLPWAGNAKLRYAALDGDWDTAIRALDSNRSAGLVTRDEAKRLKTVLLTGKALAKEAEEPEYAATLSKQAHKLMKDFVPAAVTYARVATRNGDTRSAKKVIEATWKLNPHPELAEAYDVVIAGDSVQERLKRAQRLAKLVPDHAESAMAVASAAIAASEWTLARSALEPILTTATPTERACLLMADIEEGEHGDKGRTRDWLSRAVNAERNPAWVAGSHVSDEWMPISPITGELDAFEWKVPVQQLGDRSAKIMTLEELQAETKPIEPIGETDDETIIDAEVVDHEVKDKSDDSASDETSENEQASTVKEGVVISASAAAGAVVAREVVEEIIEEAEEDVAKSKIKDQASNSKDTASTPQNDNKSDSKSDSDTNAATQSKSGNQDAAAKADGDGTSDDMRDGSDKAVMPNKLANVPRYESGSSEDDNTDNNAYDNTVEFPLKRRPDDPGPHPDKEPPKKGFKLF